MQFDETLECFEKVKIFIFKIGEFWYLFKNGRIREWNDSRKGVIDLWVRKPKLKNHKFRFSGMFDLSWSGIESGVGVGIRIGIVRGHDKYSDRMVIKGKNKESIPIFVIFWPIFCMNFQSYYDN